MGYVTKKHAHGFQMGFEQKFSHGLCKKYLEISFLVWPFNPLLPNTRKQNKRKLKLSSKFCSKEFGKATQPMDLQQKKKTVSRGAQTNKSLTIKYKPTLHISLDFRFSGIQ
jgi:hypothetical protein